MLFFPKQQQQQSNKFLCDHSLKQPFQAHKMSLVHVKEASIDGSLSQWLSKGLSGFRWALTINRSEHHPGVVIGNNVCIAVLRLVDFHVGVLPGKLLAWINGLWKRAGKNREADRREENHKRRLLSVTCIKLNKTGEEGTCKMTLLSAAITLQYTMDNKAFIWNIYKHHVSWKATVECF